MPPMTGRVIAGRYNLQQPIGRGAMGVVWRARDQLLDRDVAVKEVVISAHIGPDERRNAYQRTLREAKTAARLSHRGVVAVYDVAEEDGRPWIIMELVPSRSLDQVLSVEGRLQPLRVGRIGQQVLAALAAAHGAGVLHRDVKPSNVLIATDRTPGGWDERAVLTDFGIAQFEGDPRLTQTGMVMGSPGFTAPERIRGGDATAASDLWSLGATLYAAAEGHGPYESRGGAITTMTAIINEDAPVAPHAGRLGPLIAALLRRDPPSRPTAGTAARMFSQVLPQLGEAVQEPRAAAHPPTARSAYVPSPALPAASAPAASASVTAREESAAEPVAEEPVAADGHVPTAEHLVVAEPVAASGQGPAAEQAPSAKPTGAADGAAGAVAVVAGAGDAAGEAAGSDDLAPGADGAEDGDGIGADASVATGTPAAEPGEASETPAGEADAASPGSAQPVPPQSAAAAIVSADQEQAESPDSAGYRPTQVAIPVARASAASAAPPRPALAKPPTPSFTASSPADRIAQRPAPARPATPAPAPPPANRPAYGSSYQQGWPPPGSGQGPYADPTSSIGPVGSTSPMPPSGSQYAGPSQSYPDLAHQYAPGAGGGRRRGPGRLILLVTVAVFLAIAIGVGAAFALHHNNGNSENTANAGNTATGGPIVNTAFSSVNAVNHPGPTPANWAAKTYTASDFKSSNVKTGFSIGLPPKWTAVISGDHVRLTGPGDMLLEIDLTPHTHPDNMVTEAKYVEQTSVGAGSLADYKLQTIEPVPVLGTPGAIWQFHWHYKNIPAFTDDILFVKGSQSYALYLRGPSTDWSKKYLPVFESILHTFRAGSAS